MNATPNALAPHSGGSLLPYVIVGFGDDTWGIMDGRTGHYALVGDRLRLFRKPGSAERAAARYVGPEAITARHPFSFGPYLRAGQPRERSIL